MATQTTTPNNALVLATAPVATTSAAIALSMQLAKAYVRTTGGACTPAFANVQVCTHASGGAHVVCTVAHTPGTVTVCGKGGLAFAPSAYKRVSGALPRLLLPTGAPAYTVAPGAQGAGNVLVCTLATPGK